MARYNLRHDSNSAFDKRIRWDGRAVECTSLENWHRLIAYLGFESLSHRHIRKTSFGRFFYGLNLEGYLLEEALLKKTASAELSHQPPQGYKERSSTVRTFEKTNRCGLLDFFVLMRL